MDLYHLSNRESDLTSRRLEWKKNDFVSLLRVLLLAYSHGSFIIILGLHAVEIWAEYSLHFLSLPVWIKKESI